MGKPGFPIPPPGGRVWEGDALPGTIVCSSRRCAVRAAWGSGVTHTEGGTPASRLRGQAARAPTRHVNNLQRASFLCRSGPLGYNEAGLIRHGVEGCCRPMPQGRPLALPLRKNARLRCAARGVPVRWRLLASSADVNTVRSVQPPSQPPPAGGRSRTPSPSGGGSGRGPSPCPGSRDAGGMPAHPGHMYRAECAPRIGPDLNIGCWSRGMGKPGFPTSPPAGRLGRAQPSQEQP